MGLRFFVAPKTTVAQPIDTSDSNSLLQTLVNILQGDSKEATNAEQVKYNRGITHPPPPPLTCDTVNSSAIVTMQSCYQATASHIPNS